MKEFLADLGINVGLSVAGFFGSLLMVGKNSAADLRTTFTSMVAGVASANYLTPVVVDVLKLNDTGYDFALAFLIGFMGLRLVEVASKKLFKNVK